tara:strand:- start:738 stop:938 length:201 start_codon:yes stop_codon:yes gene_type:complete
MSASVPGQYCQGESALRSTATTSHAASIGRLPRGWTILGLALASWVLVGGMWAAASQVYGFVAGAF